ncbi:hypothetical protein DSCO28_24300 [Desulfosarcina ovata subsp. sediminis]|uniref:histidine kinase n=1 Tax=Desulfosarcina ovata subsp. sediminis TaxID=885957 RepID=A0A5K7ZKG3_9BACT|nr:HAMP domain-containing sensor histidine kinase [Desulfosarcina ovata]BBO81864.1 hypothetical protein DSCO28_24300 [Desulfosarcina ovata subsp. sediminis]
MLKTTSLRNKIILYISSVAIVFLAAGIYPNLKADFRIQYENVTAKANALADEIGYAFEVLTIHEDDYSLRRVVEQTATIELVEEVGITDREGRYLVHNRQGRIGESMAHPLLARVIEEERRHVSVEADKLVVIQPLHGEAYLARYRSDVIGSIVIVMDLAPFNARMRQRALVISLATIAFVALLGLCLGVVVNQLIIRPVGALSVATKQLTDGDWNARVAHKRKDEIGDLAFSFNFMAGAVAEREERLRIQKEEIQKANDELERRVAERTVELVQTAEQLRRELVLRKRTEASLRESEERLSVTLSSIGDAVIATGVAGEVTLMNPVAEQLTGWTRTEAYGRDSQEIFNIINEETGIRVESPVEKVLRRGIVVGLANHTILISKNGVKIPIDDSGAPIRDDKGNVLGVVLIFRDVTEKRRSRKALKEYSERLEEMVASRTKELRDAQKELVRKERLAALGQLTATVAHEIRNPLGTVRTSIFSLSENIERNEKKRVDRALLLAERNILRCDRIITELLDFTRQKNLKKRPVKIDSWLEHLLAEQTIPEEIEYKLALDSGVSVPVDTEYLRRAVVNVIANALQALEEKGGTEMGMTVRTTIAGERIEIGVADTGPGISDDIREKIFEPLFSTKSIGVGLGLSIVEDIMAEHDGGVEIESEPGKGTEVVLWLPVAKQRPATNPIDDTIVK